MARYIDVDELLENMRRHRQHSVPFEYIKSLTPAHVAPVPKWISVKERLPENRGQYIIYMRGQEPFVSWFDGDIFRSPSTVPIECPATHWMPLPEPPKEKGENA